MGRLSENSVLNLKNKSHSVTAEIDVPDGGANGVIIAQGGEFGGWSAVPARRQGARTATTCSASRASMSAPTTAVPAGTHQVRMEFAYDGGGLGKGGDVTLFVDGDKVGRGEGGRHRADGVLGRRDGRPRLRHRRHRWPPTTRR